MFAPRSLASATLLLFLAAHSLQSAELAWSHSRALVDAPFDLELSTDPPGAEIRYTLNSTPPSLGEGTLYSGPIRIEGTTVVRAVTVAAEGAMAKIETHSYLFPEQVANQEAYPQDYLREIVSGRNGPARPHTFDWAMDPEVLDDTANNGDLTAHLQEIPTLSVVMARADLNFIYGNHLGRGADFERAASIELIYPDKDPYASFDGFHIDCGIRMQGGGAGDQARKKSFRLLFKSIYGTSSLKYPLFESAVHFGGNAASSFEGVVLRAGGNTNWSKDDAWKHEPSTYLRDPLVRDSQIAISGIGSRSVFVHLYLNGYYFGLYNIAERPEENFMASYLGGRAEDYYAINHSGTLEGDPQRWEDSVSPARLSDLAKPVPYAAFSERVAIPAYCDYILLNWLVGMGDWPWNNFFGGVSNTPPGKLHFFCWDSEYAFWTLEGYLRSNPNGWVNANFPEDRGTIASLWKALIQNEDFRMAFADRVYRHCFNDGALTDANLAARFQRLAAFIENPIVAESARWGDSAWGREDDPHTRARDWIPNRDAVLDLIDGNVEIFVRALRAEGLYPAFDPPVVTATGTADSTRLSLENPNAQGNIYYTLDGSDPRLPGGNLSPGATQYTEPFSIQGATLLRSRVLQVSLFGGSESSALREQLCLDTQIGFPLRITELMYHPETSEALEFVELQNVSNARLDLTGIYFRGIDYRFKPGAQLEPNAIIVLIPNDDPELFAQTYPDVSVFDTYKRHLANDGETVSLFDAEDRLLTSVTFDDDIVTAWPAEADGGGFSLETTVGTSPATEAAHWRASLTPGGSPGVVAAVAPDPDRDTDRDGFSDTAESIAGTDPADPHSFLGLHLERIDRSTVRFRFESAPQRSYSLEVATALAPGEDEWIEVMAFPPEDATTQRTQEYGFAQNASAQFFRLVVRLP